MTEDELKLAIDKETNEMNAISSEISGLKLRLDQKRVKVEKLKQKLNTLQGKCYYVYVVYVNGEPKYVGKGKDDRYKHAVSGASSVPELNRDFFNDSHIEVRILFGQKNLTEEEAFQSEKDVIGSLDSIYDIYNKSIPKEDEYTYMDCDLKEYSDLAIRNKDYPWHSERWSGDD